MHHDFYTGAMEPGVRAYPAVCDNDRGFGHFWDQKPLDSRCDGMNPFQVCQQGPNFLHNKASKPFNACTSQDMWDWDAGCNRLLSALRHSQKQVSSCAGADCSACLKFFLCRPILSGPALEYNFHLCPVIGCPVCSNRGSCQPAHCGTCMHERTCLDLPARSLLGLPLPMSRKPSGRFCNSFIRGASVPPSANRFTSRRG